jgi:NADH-quinone oxidoreductase subunit A
MVGFPSFILYFTSINLTSQQLLEYALCIIVLVVLLVLFSFAVAPAAENTEKSSSYECGFEPFGDARTNFDVHFYIVGILFLIFDLEIVFLYPWVYSVVADGQISHTSLFGILFFLILLGLGFVYEWKKQALSWSPSP